MARNFHGVRTLVLFVGLLAGAGMAGVAEGARITPGQLPEVLRDWVDWVLFPDPGARCPFVHSRGEDRRCAWPTALELDSDEAGGSFRQRWSVYAESWVILPGDVRRWPQDVRTGGGAVTVTQRDGRPAVRLGPGQHELTGTFLWATLPESLPVPADTGLVRLTVAGARVTLPVVDDAGNLWLRERGGEAGAAVVGNRVELRVFRQVVDDLPLQVTTRVDMTVSGAQREESIAGVLPAGFIPLRIESRLPARMEEDGRLRLQVRPGRWVVQVTARHPEPVTSLPLASWPAPWPEEEVWLFDARTALRLVEVTGAPAVDPVQAGVPEPWRTLPAYLVRPGSALTFEVIRRGDPEPAPDALTLQRHLWLDFDGGGFTLRDTLSGTMTRGWRLEMNAPTRLGQALLDDRPQLITTRAGGKPGVEVRRGQVNLVADSRYEASRSRVPAVGWDQDFQQVEAQLHLPPGWKLFSASGVDNVPDTWMKRWTLLDIFLVLIAALAVRGLWHWRLGLLALVTLVLIWHEPGAPRAIWLHVLAPIALLRVLPEGWFRRIATWYRNLALISLVVIAVPFMVQQVRIGLYPQLDDPGATPVFDAAVAHMGSEPAAAPPMEAMSSTREMMAAPEAAMEITGAAADAAVDQAQRLVKRSPRARPSTQSLARLDDIDPEARVQTGPGLPDWQWRTVPLQWNGPVQRDQEMHFTLLSPAMNLFLDVARVLLVAALALVVMGVPWPRWPRVGRATGLSGVTGLVIVAGWLAASLYPASAHADIPGDGMLEELKARLTAAPECLPDCAQVARLRVDMTPGTVVLRAEIHAMEPVAVPLPAQPRTWTPAEVTVDGSPATGLMRGHDGLLWIALAPGVHQVLLRGVPPAASTFPIPLPLVPRRVDTLLQGWSVEGVDQDLAVGNQLQFTRIRGSGSEDEKLAELQPGELPPLLRVERTLRLGLDWHVETRLARISPAGAAVAARVPLLPGESVTTPDITVQDGHVLVNLGPRDAGLAWNSTLEKQPRIELVAPRTTQWVETWRADIGTIWHAALSGIAVVHHQDAEGRWLPEWRPWPGESVVLDLSRPAGVPGETLTLDGTRLEVAPGRRAADTTATLTLRASRGGQHTVVLPAEAVLQGVEINGTAQPLRQEGRKLTLPVVPGVQTVVLTWRESRGIGALFRSPEFDTGLPGVNTRVHVNLGEDRWVWMLGGPPLGPAVLFWGVLLVVVLLAAGLGRVPWTPLTHWQWGLLGIGLTQTDVWVALIVVGWLLALGARARLRADTGRLRFNAIQVGLFLLTLLALAMLFEAVKHGLLGFPQMQIAGNGSTAWDLHWYQDRSDAALPRAWILSVPLVAYRALMLAWALWLAFALLRWLRWGWECFGRGGLWKSRPLQDVVLGPGPGPGGDSSPGT